MRDISVVIPMYNSEETILGALDSIKNQTAFHRILEIIIVNDGATDRSRDVVERYAAANPDMPIALINQDNGGVSAARNRGLAAAAGEWIALLDSDDEWLGDKTEYQFSIIDRHPDIDFLGGNTQTGGFRILGRSINGLYRVHIKDLCKKQLPQPSTALFRRKIYQEIGGFDETRRYAEDGQYFMRICLRYRYFVEPRQVVVYGGGKRGFGQSGLSANLKRMYEGNVINLREIRQSHAISPGFYGAMRVFFLLKYVRRIVISKAARHRGSEVKPT